MKVIYHKDQPLLEFPDEPWRPPLRMAVNRSAGANSLSVWLADLEAQQRTPLHWHDTEEVLVFLEVDGDGFARLGDVGERDRNRGDRDGVEAEDETGKKADADRREARLAQCVTQRVDVHRLIRTAPAFVRAHGAISSPTGARET